MHRRRAFTLIEALIVFALATLLLGVITQLFVSGLQVTRKAKVLSERENRVRTTLDRILLEQQEAVAYLDVPPGNLAALNSVGTAILRFVKVDRKYPPGQQTRWVQFHRDTLTAEVVRSEGLALGSGGSWVSQANPFSEQVLATEVATLRFTGRPLGPDQIAGTQLIDLVLILQPENR